MNNVMSLGIYFEITDAELYGGKDSIGYAATIVGITANALQKMDFAKYADRQREATADMCKVPLENGRRKEHICRNHSESCPEDNGLSKNKYQEPGRTPEIESEVHNCKGKDLPAQRAGADRSGNMPEVNRQPQLAVCNSGLRNQNIRRDQNGRRYSGGWPSRKR